MYKLMFIILVVLSGCNPITSPDCFEGDVKGIASPVTIVATNSDTVARIATPVNQRCVNGTWE